MLNGRTNEWTDGRRDDLDNKWLLARLERCEGETTARVGEGKDGSMVVECVVGGWIDVCMVKKLNRRRNGRKERRGNEIK